jgi:PAS domain S-box-containing protein
MFYLLRKKLGTNGEQQECELRMMLPGGTLFRVRLHAVLMTDADDTPHCRMVLTDISEPKQCEQALRANEQRLGFLFHNASDIQVILNPDGTLRYLSPAAERITGFPLSSLEGQVFGAFIHPEDTHKVQAAWQETLAHPEKSVTVQFRHAHKTTGWVCLEVIAQNFVTEPSINGVIASVRDISERYELEQKSRQHERDLEAIFNATTESIHLIDAQGTVLLANEHSARRLGTTVEEMIGRPLFDFFPPEVAARRKKRIEELKAAGQPWTTIDQRDGRFFETSLWPMKDADGSVHRIAIFSKEVTERLAAKQALSRSQTLLNATQRLARIGGWEWDVEEQSLTWTAETYRIHGFTPDDQPADGPNRSAGAWPVTRPKTGRWLPRPSGAALKRANRMISASALSPLTAANCGSAPWVSP